MKRSGYSFGKRVDKEDEEAIFTPTQNTSPVKASLERNPLPSHQRPSSVNKNNAYYPTHTPTNNNHTRLRTRRSASPRRSSIGIHTPKKVSRTPRSPYARRSLAQSNLIRFSNFNNTTSVLTPLRDRKRRAASPFNDLKLLSRVLSREKETIRRSTEQLTPKTTLEPPVQFNYSASRHGYSKKPDRTSLLQDEDNILFNFNFNNGDEDDEDTDIETSRIISESRRKRYDSSSSENSNDNFVDPFLENELRRITEGIKNSQHLFNNTLRSRLSDLSRTSKGTTTQQVGNVSQFFNQGDTTPTPIRKRRSRSENQTPSPVPFNFHSLLDVNSSLNPQSFHSKIDLSKDLSNTFINNNSNNLLNNSSNLLKNNNDNDDDLQIDQVLDVTEEIRSLQNRDSSRFEIHDPTNEFSRSILSDPRVSMGTMSSDPKISLGSPMNNSIVGKINLDEDVTPPNLQFPGRTLDDPETGGFDLTNIDDMKQASYDLSSNFIQDPIDDGPELQDPIETDILQGVTEATSQEPFEKMVSEDDEEEKQVDILKLNDNENEASEINKESISEVEFEEDKRQSIEPEISDMSMQHSSAMPIPDYSKEQIETVTIKAPLNDITIDQVGDTSKLSHYTDEEARRRLSEALSNPDMSGMIIHDDINDFDISLTINNDIENLGIDLSQYDGEKTFNNNEEIDDVTITQFDTSALIGGFAPDVQYNINDIEKLNIPKDDPSKLPKKFIKSVAEYFLNETPNIEDNIFNKLLPSKSKSQKLNPQVLELLYEISDTFMKNQCEDLIAFADHANRKTININDTILLFKRSSDKSFKKNILDLIFSQSNDFFSKELLNEIEKDLYDVSVLGKQQKKVNKQ